MEDVKGFINIVESGYRRHHRHSKSEVSTEELHKAVEHLISDVKLIVGLYDIPYTAGYNKNGTVIYIDKEMPQYMVLDHVKLDLHRCIAVHEIVEASLLHSYRNNLFYLEAHQIATRIEKDYVESFGVDWQDYNDYVEKWVARIYSREVYKNIPADLDPQPYLDDNDVELLTRMGISTDTQ